MLTTRQLVWRRHGFSLPVPKPNEVRIRLDEIIDVTADDIAGAFGVLKVRSRHGFELAKQSREPSINSTICNRIYRRDGVLSRIR